MSLSNTQKISLESSIESLYKSKKSKTLLALKSHGISTISDFLWILPLRVERIPSLSHFKNLEYDHFFRGVGEVVNIQKHSNPRVRGRGKIPLLNIKVIIKDFFSDEHITLRWFNSYPSNLNKIEGSEYLNFLGKPQSFGGLVQIVNPEITGLSEVEVLELREESHKETFKIQYPTVNKIQGSSIKKLIAKVPIELWSEIQEILPKEFIAENNFLDLKSSFMTLHGVGGNYNEKTVEQARRRLIFEEFFLEQAKLFVRRKKFKNQLGIKVKKTTQSLHQLFPYPFTKDQLLAVQAIEKDMSNGKPMMRLIQGDVGSGKTWVAFYSCLLAIDNKLQAAIMCPTESLARQHYTEAQELFNKSGFKTDLLLGSTKGKDRKEVLKNLAVGDTHLLIGTQSLIQDTVQFKKLGLAVIDEQHKFGVNQRLKLISKGEGCHSLIMTATPIPRSLSLTQYGDLDITSIKSAPSTRKGFKTRIVDEKNFKDFLSFVKTRLSLLEQVYIVVPAIEESEILDINNLGDIHERFKSFFPNNKIMTLHGKMSNLDKEEAFLRFKNGDAEILIATSMVEVGINVPNATIMAILNPERFGLSSLHQLRGRVGRAEKPGFCFLLIDRLISREAFERLKFIENNADGFKIAEEDLRIRGQGNLLGKDQSGTDTYKKLANPVAHYNLLVKAKEQIEYFSKSEMPRFNSYLKRVSLDKIVENTI